MLSPSLSEYIISYFLTYLKFPIPSPLLTLTGRRTLCFVNKTDYERELFYILSNKLKKKNAPLALLIQCKNILSPRKGKISPPEY